MTTRKGATLDMSYVILGGGSVTAEFYLPAFDLLGLAGAVTVVDPFERSLAPLREAWPQMTFVTEDHIAFLKSLKKAGPERIIVALPNHLHIEAMELALAKGRHVLCEKPLALQATECARLAELAASKGVVLKAAMSRRYLASLMLARQIIQAGELGKVKEIEVRDCSSFQWKPRSFAFFAPESGGVLADMGVHYLDFLDTVVGPLKPVAYGDDASGGTESSARYQLSAGKVPVSLRLSRLYDAGAYIRIACERGEIRVAKGVETGLSITPQSGPVRSLSVEHPFENPQWPADFHGSFCQMLADFERAIEGQPTPIADAADAERATALIEWAYTKRRPLRPARVQGRPTVLVTGATGFIGGHLVERLTAAGDVNVRASVRSPSSCTNLARFPVEMTPINLLDPASVKAAVEGATTVYHLAYGKDGASAPSITIDGTKNVVEAAIAAGCESVVVLSTMYVFGFPKGARPVDETFPNNPYGGEYGTSKSEMERWCLERAKTSGKTRIVILNPTCVFGPGGGAYSQMPVDMAREGRFCWISDGAGSCNYTYVGNVVDAVLAAAATPEAHGERFIINDGVTTWKDFFEPLLAPLDKDIPSFTPQELDALPRFGGPFNARDLVSAIISSERVRTVAKRSALVRKYFERVSAKAQLRGQAEHALSYKPAEEVPEPVYPPEWLGELFSPQRATFSSEKAARVLGWRPRRDLEQARQETLAWLRETGRLPPVSGN